MMIQVQKVIFLVVATFYFGSNLYCPSHGDVFRLISCGLIVNDNDGAVDHWERDKHKAPITFEYSNLLAKLQFELSCLDPRFRDGVSGATRPILRRKQRFIESWQDGSTYMEPTCFRTLEEQIAWKLHDVIVAKIKPSDYGRYLEYRVWFHLIPIAMDKILNHLRVVKCSNKAVEWYIKKFHFFLLAILCPAGIRLFNDLHEPLTAMFIETFNQSTNKTQDYMRNLGLNGEHLNDEELNLIDKMQKLVAIRIEKYVSEIFPTLTELPKYLVCPSTYSCSVM